LTAKVPLSMTPPTPAREPSLPLVPLPSCSVPAEIVVPPE
jgi:hypothetical protein